MPAVTTNLESFCRTLRGSVRFDEPLGPRTWMGLGGCAEALFVPADEDALADALQRAARREIPVRVLGGGANLLVPDEGVKGLVIALEGSPWCAVQTDRATGIVHAGGGADLPRLVTQTAEVGLAGLGRQAGP